MHMLRKAIIMQNEGYDKHQWMKRARAFRMTIFPSCARRIILQKHYGYGYMADATLKGMMRILKQFVKKLIDHEHIRAYNYTMTAFIEFLILIEYLIDHNSYLKIQMMGDGT